MIKKLLLAGAATAFFITATTSAILAGTLEDIVARGKVVVGVKADYAPWGMRDASGNLVGMEHDRLADLAKPLGEKAGKTPELEKVVVAA